MNLLIQFIVGIAIAILIFVLYKCELFKNDSIMLWFFLVLVFLLLSNAIFYLCYEKKIEFVSVLDYKDAQLMIISLVPTVAIAFFQHKFQQIFNQETEKREQENTLKNESEEARLQQWHRQELCSDRIHEFYSFFNLQGEAINLNINECLGKYGYLESVKNNGYIFSLELNPIGKQELFPGYYKVAFSNVFINGKKAETVDGLDSKITNNHLLFRLKQGFAYPEIISFFSQAETNTNTLKCSFDIDLEDLSLEKGYLHMLLSISFDIVILKSYDKNGSIKIGASNVKIELNKLYGFEGE